MSKPIVAVVGRPNVGKSTLFNKLCGQRLAIVEDTPGITRDRIFANCEWSGHEFMLVDTGGIEPKATEGILAHMREQAEIAIDTADCIIMVVDVRDGLTAADEEVAHMLRRSHKPIILAVNKCDKTGEAPMELYEFYNLGFDEVLPISSVHGHGTGDMLDAVYDLLPPEDELEDDEDAIHVAIIGKPNVGKSSLVNRIAGEERAIVSNIAGTTRDATDTVVENEEGKFVLIDTAGIRKKARVTERIEHYSVLRAYMAVDRADVCLILIDATEGFTEQDSKVAGYAHEQGKASIIVVNKWDLIEKDNSTMKEFEEKLQRDFSFMSYAPFLFISAKTGQRVPKLFAKIHEVYQQNAMRISTGMLNDVLAYATTRVQAHHHRNAQLRPGRRPDPGAAPHGQGPPPEDLLHDPGGHPPPSFCVLLQRRPAVPLLLSAVYREPDSLDLRADGNAGALCGAGTGERRKVTGENDHADTRNFAFGGAVLPAGQFQQLHFGGAPAETQGYPGLWQPQCRADQYAALFWKRLCGADPGGRPGKGHHRRAALPWHL